MAEESYPMKKRGRGAGQRAANQAVRTLAVDVGGTGIKALTLGEEGQPITDRVRIPTPKRATPKAVIGIIRKLAARQDGFERVSVGFPGVVKDGVVYTAPNLGKGWSGFELEKALRKKLGCPVRVANDADVQGLGCVSGRGMELVITLGTGFGSVLFADGRRIHLELGHHPFHQGKTYEEELGRRALKRHGKKKWNRHLREAIADLKRTFNYDRLYLGGGSPRYINFRLPPGVKAVSNAEGLLGGTALWHEQASPHAPAPLAGRKRARAGSAGGAGSRASQESMAFTPAAKDAAGPRGDSAGEQPGRPVVAPRTTGPRG